jgi:glycosyltransferase involved in cell wall biosynthesis
MMRVLYLTRRDGAAHRGGDTVQLEQTCRAVADLGVTIDVAYGVPSRSVRGYDLVHVFNLQRPGETAAQISRIRPLPYVISPILADTTALERSGRSAMRTALWRIAPAHAVEAGKQIRRVWLGSADAASLRPFLWDSVHALRSSVLTRAAAVHPNSRWEADYLRRLAPINDTAMQVIPNGVDAALLQTGDSAEEFRRAHGISESRFALCVARFDERKNNLAVVRVARKTQLPVVLIGRPAPLHRGYYQRCLELAAGAPWIRFVSAELRQQELMGAYRAAHTHLLPSWLETPGLASLEAALAGANIVVGECPAVREYFGASAWYCDPASDETIAVAVKSAMGQPRDVHTLSATVQRLYSWSSIGQAQLRAYQQALAAIR